MLQRTKSRFHPPQHHPTVLRFVGDVGVRVDEFVFPLNERWTSAVMQTEPLGPQTVYAFKKRPYVFVAMARQFFVRDLTTQRLLSHSEFPLVPYEFSNYVHDRVAFAFSKNEQFFAFLYKAVDRRFLFLRFLTNHLNNKEGEFLLFDVTKFVSEKFLSVYFIQNDTHLVVLPSHGAISIIPLPMQPPYIIHTYEDVPLFDRMDHFVDDDHLYIHNKYSAVAMSLKKFGPSGEFVKCKYIYRNEQSKELAEQGYVDLTIAQITPRGDECWLLLEKSLYSQVMFRSISSVSLLHDEVSEHQILVRVSKDGKIKRIALPNSFFDNFFFIGNDYVVFVSVYYAIFFQVRQISAGFKLIYELTIATDIFMHPKNHVLVRQHDDTLYIGIITSNAALSVFRISVKDMRQDMERFDQVTGWMHEQRILVPVLSEGIREHLKSLLLW